MSYDNDSNEPLHILQFPDIILEQIMMNFSYHEIATLRIVCQRFNVLNKRLLNRGFHAAEHFHLKCQKEVKGELPRRESERRDHPLAHHCNILSGIETRLSLLNMTFLKYIDAKFCCFIPGKVIDELFRVLRFVQSTKNIFIKGGASNDAKNNILKELRANVILKELRDISSMAMEHFEEHILPNFKAAAATPLLSFTMSSPQHFSNAFPSFDASPLFTVSRPISRCIEPQAMSSRTAEDNGNKNDINVFKNQISILQSKLSDARRKINEQEQVVLELNRVLSEQMSKLADHESKLTEINRTLAENDRKVATFMNMHGSEAWPQTLLTMLTQTKGTIQGGTSNSLTSTSEVQSVPQLAQQAFIQLATYFINSGMVQPAESSTTSSSSVSSNVDAKLPNVVLPKLNVTKALKYEELGNNKPKENLLQFISNQLDEKLEHDPESIVTRNNTRKRRKINEFPDSCKISKKTKRNR